MTKTSEKILETIRQGRIKPEPRWHFLLKNYVFWSLFALSVILGSLAFSVIMHTLDSGDLDILDHAHGNFFSLMIMLAPYFWMLSMIVFAVVAYLNCRHTRRAYRLRRRWILLGSVAISVLVGSAFYKIGLGKEIDGAMAKSFPVYVKSKIETRKKLWLQPESGLLTGEIVKEEENGSFVVKDTHGRQWEVRKENISETKPCCNRKGREVKVIGKKDGEDRFVAKEIRKWDEDEDDDEDKGEEKAEDEK